MTYDCDLFVIGGGSGGVRAARVSAAHGAKVMVAEEYRVGGTCVIRGCVPKKFFVYAGRFRDEIEDARAYGWEVGEPRFDWRKFKTARDAEVLRLEGAYRRTLGNAGAAILDERAVLKDAHTIETASGRKITAKHMLIATGGWPVPLEVPGGELAITSNEIFELEEQPQSVIVLGGGYIALEFACIFAALGTKTTVLYRGEQILRGFDDDLRFALAEGMRTRGIEVCTMADPGCLLKSSGGLVVETKDGRRFTAGKVVAAVGRRPSTSGIGLEEAGVDLTKSGAVRVDRHSKSSVDNIHAVGDVTDRVNLTPVAIREGHAFADTVFGGRKVEVDHSKVPSAVFTTPEIGTVGLTEAKARQEFESIDIYKSSFRPMKTLFAGREDRMLMKLVVDGKSGKVLGCHLLGPDAAEMIQLVAIPLVMGATKADIDAAVAVHPTAAEELVTMREKWRPPA
ncbi:MAG: glutathione-disulfide reductase [Parvibaculaceae bacterium]